MPGEQEGVVKFELRFTPAPPVAPDWVRELSAWRRILHLTGLVGRDPQRYGGVGYGNVSRRLPAAHAGAQPRFLISGTQTGHLPVLDAGHYATVLACHPEGNRIVAEGPVHPSSEAMTHGVLYALDEAVQYVMHVHSPEIWRHARALGLPATPADVAYGTPAMAEAVRRLLRDGPARERSIFAMAGHEDGIIAFGRSAEEAGQILLRHLARAFRLEG